MDKFVQATSDIGVGCRSDGSTVMAYFDGNTVTGLWNYAQRFAMNDNSYGTTFGPSTPGPVNLVSGQTGNAVIALTFSNGTITSTSPLMTITSDPDPALDDCGADQGGTKTGRHTGHRGTSTYDHRVDADHDEHRCVLAQILNGNGVPGAHGIMATLLQQCI